MEDNFVLDKEKEYLVYGVGGNGLLISQRLEELGYQLKGFIDKRADSLGTVRDKPVWNLDTLEDLKAEADRIIIIISIKNVFGHSDIADELARRGFRQCIYKPMPVLKGYSDEKLEEISKAHDALFIEGNVPGQTALSRVCQSDRMYYKDRLLIEQGGTEVLAWMPLELLFNYKESDAYEQLNMSTFFPLGNLYRLFSGVAMEKADGFLNDFYCYASEWACQRQIVVTEELKKSWVESRMAAFLQMQEIVDFDFGFFHRSAPWVQMHDLGKFYLTCSGRNRVVFLAARGYCHVPVRLTLEDYEKWLHRDAFGKLREYMEEQHIRKFSVPVPHPYLKDMPTEEAQYYQLVCFPIVTFLFRLIYHKARKKEREYIVSDKDEVRLVKNSCSIICDMTDHGAFSRFLDRCGLPVRRVMRQDVLTKILDELFYQYIEETQPQKEEYCKVFIIDNRKRIIKRKTEKRAERIICVESEADTGNFDGYLYEETLSNIFEMDGMKKVNVYKIGIV